MYIVSCQGKGGQGRRGMLMHETTWDGGAVERGWTYAIASAGTFVWGSFERGVTEVLEDFW